MVEAATAADFLVVVMVVSVVGFVVVAVVAGFVALASAAVVVVTGFVVDYHDGSQHRGRYCKGLIRCSASSFLARRWARLPRHRPNPRRRSSPTGKAAHLLPPPGGMIRASQTHRCPTSSDRSSWRIPHLQPGALSSHLSGTRRWRMCTNHPIAWPTRGRAREARQRPRTLALGRARRSCQRAS